MQHVNLPAMQQLAKAYAPAAIFTHHATNQQICSPHISPLHTSAQSTSPCPASLHEALATSTPAIRSPPHLLIALTQLVQPATVRGPFNSSCEPTSMQVCIQSTNKSYADPYVRASCEPPRTPSPAFSLSCTPSHSLLSRQTLLAS